MLEHIQGFKFIQPGRSSYIRTKHRSVKGGFIVFKECCADSRDEGANMLKIWE